VHTPWGDSVDVTLADAREVAASLAQPGTVPRSSGAQWRLPGSWTHLSLNPILPDGNPP
jgi:hypothetical protein